MRCGDSLWSNASPLLPPTSSELAIDREWQEQWGLNVAVIGPARISSSREDAQTSGCQRSLTDPAPFVGTCLLDDLDLGSREDRYVARQLVAQEAWPDVRAEYDGADDP